MQTNKKSCSSFIVKSGKWREKEQQGTAVAEFDSRHPEKLHTIFEDIVFFRSFNLCHKDNLNFCAYSTVHVLIIYGV